MPPLSRGKASCGPSTGRIGKGLCRGNCRLRRFLPDCAVVKFEAPMRVRSLEPVYNRFGEGFGTSDLVVARALIDEP